MDLIIKPTEICNFACTFCSSTKLVENKASRLDLDYVFRFLDRYPETNTIIVNGGDPLIMDPDYYWKIIEYCEENDYGAILSLTTNLWDFYKNPDKWVDLFRRRDRVGVSTSFQYGEGRRINKNKVFTEDIFLKVMDLFYEKVGYKPGFIAVIDWENRHRAIDTVRLAKYLNVEAKLNYADASGEQAKPFPLSYIYEIYLDIIEEGLAEWEHATKQLIKIVKGMGTLCPLKRDCDEGIRVLQPEGDYYSCGGFGDEKMYSIDFEKEVLEMGPKQTPLQNARELDSLKDECWTCPMFSICNGCRKHIHDLKKSDMVETHCSHMKSQSARVMQLADDKTRRDYLNTEPYA